jgi:hypothetical protein
MMQEKQQYIFFLLNEVNLGAAASTGVRVIIGMGVITGGHKVIFQLVHHFPDPCILTITISLHAM